MILAWLAACSNHAPVLRSINGNDPVRERPGSPFDQDDEDPATVYLYTVKGMEPGGHAVLRLDVDDPDGDDVRVVFYGTPGRLDWDPERHVATVDLFDPILAGSRTGWYVSLLDDGVPPLSTEVLLDFDFYDHGDSGDSGHSGLP